MKLVYQSEEEKEYLLDLQRQKFETLQKTFPKTSPPSCGFNSLSFFKNRAPESFTVYHISVDKPHEKSKSRSTDIGAEIPDHNSSDQRDIQRINEAGKLFIELGDCPPLNKYAHSFSRKLKYISDVEVLLDAVFSSLKVLTITAATGNILSLFTNLKDLKSMLYASFTALLSSDSIDEKKDYEFCSPLIPDKGGIAWIKCEFSSKFTVRKKFFVGKKSVDITLNCFTFYFPTIRDFNRAFSCAKESKQ